jgi:hypothetical protein
MADPVITNPGYANIPPGVRLTPQRDEWYGLDPNITIASLVSAVPATIATNLSTPGAGVGQCVYLQGWNGATSAATGSPDYPTVALSTTTAQGNLIGIITGTTVAGNPVSVVGTTTNASLVQVRNWGIAGVIVDGTTTVGHALVQSTSVAGALHDSGGVGGTQGETVGFVLQALTVSSGTGYCLAFIKLT